MKPTQPVTKDVVLLGGGHAHLFVLKAFGLRPAPGVRLTVITRDIESPYSGMLPGHMAGHYTRDECHVDLRPLAGFAGARLFHEEAIGLDRAAKRVICAGRPPVPYDVLSIDVGSRPRQDDVPGAAEHAVPLKPIDRSIGRWEAVVARARSGAPGAPFRLCVVGGGAAGVEVSLAAEYRLRRELEKAGLDPRSLEITLVAGDGILPSHPPRVRRIFTRVLRERGITVHAPRAAVRVEPNLLHLDGGGTVAFDAALWATQAGAAPWLAASGLDCSPGGFVLVDETLRSTNDPAIFAAGDVADMVGHPRPKAGVFAVRQGGPLAENLRAACEERPLERYLPQKRFLTIVTTGNRRAVASKGRFAVDGEWVWRWKDRLDRRFMKMFRDLDAMPRAAPPGAPSTMEEEMRCRGCGAKVASSVLARVLERLRTGEPASGDVVVGLAVPDDAAVVRPPKEGELLVQSVDFFPSFVEDPFVFGRIAAVHALGDLHAMGAEPRTALAIATVAIAAEEKMEDSLHQMMAGALSVFRAEGVALVGGHSSEGAECALGFSVEGVARESALLRKSSLSPGQSLVLTKPLGTGVLLVADQHRKAKGRWIDAALASMQRSNRAAGAILVQHGATACTDVTGFGFAGHLLEMVKPAGLGAEIDLAALPFLDGALEAAAAGFESSLHPANARAAGAFRDAPPDPRDPRSTLLFDPQTAGGLLAAVPADRADACVQALRNAGETCAIVGRVLPGDAMEPLHLRR